jgi:hypothetical protein
LSVVQKQANVAVETLTIACSKTRGNAIVAKSGRNMKGLGTTAGLRIVVLGYIVRGPLGGQRWATVAADTTSNFPRPLASDSGQCERKIDNSYALGELSARGISGDTIRDEIRFIQLVA